MQKIKIISFSLSDLRKKYIETQILLEHYMKNIITDSWTDFKQSESAVNIIDQNQCDIENWKYSIEQFTHKHYKECFPSEGFK